MEPTARPLWQTFLITVSSIAVLLVLACSSLYSDRPPDTLPRSLTIDVTIFGSSDLKPDDIRVDAVSLLGGLDPFLFVGALSESLPPGKPSGRLGFEWTYIGIIKEIRVALPKDYVTQVDFRVQIGNMSFNFSREDLPRSWGGLHQGWMDYDGKMVCVLTSPPNIRTGSSRLPYFSSAINWPGDRSVAREIFKRRAPYLGAVIVAILLCGFARLNSREPLISFTELILGANSEGKPYSAEKGRSGVVWCSFGALVVALSIAILEYAQPFYFTQDDNLSQFLPFIIDGCRNAFVGVFPNWNPYQLLGAPAANVGVYSLTYPLTYLSYWVANSLLGNEFATLEVFCAVHLMVGYLSVYFLARRSGIRPILSATAGFCFVLSGYYLIGGRSWYYMLPVAVWLPLIMIGLTRINEHAPGWKWFVLTGLAIGAFFHAGNAQMWAYSMLFLCLAWTLMTLERDFEFKRFCRLAPALAFGLAVAAPLLLPQMIFAGTVARYGGYGASIADGLTQMIFPYPVAAAAHPEGWGSTNIELMGQFYYSGTVLTLAAVTALLLVVGFLANFRWRGAGFSKVLANNKWLACGCVCLLLAMGSEGGIWTLLSQLPVFNKFAYPFKFMALLNLFLALAGALVLERMLRQSSRPAKWELILCFAACGLILYHVTLARTSFYSFHEKPYPALPTDLLRILHGTDVPGNARIDSITPERSAQGDYFQSMPLDLPSIWRIPSAGGYDPLVENSPENMAAQDRFIADPLAAYEAYGVKWALVSDLAINPVTSGNPNVERMERPLANSCIGARLKALQSKAKIRLSLPKLTIWELPKAAPMAFAATCPNIALPIHWDGAGATVDVSSSKEGGQVIINALWRPEMKAEADGLSVPVVADHVGRNLVATPPYSKTLKLLYSPRWGLGIAVGLGLAALGAVMAWLLIRTDSGRH